MKPSLTVALVACLLAACGQTGALYLPDEGVTTPVEIRPAPATPPEAPAGPDGADAEPTGETPAPPPGKGP